MKRSCILLASLACPVAAHVVSLSTGELRIEGARARYELRMPAYEAAHIATPEAAVFANLAFSSGGQRARLLRRSCRMDREQGAFYCEGEFEFPALEEQIDATCTFHRIVVPNHVHVLRAVRDGREDQAVFDASYTEAPIRFAPPGALATALRQAASGVVQGAGGIAQLLCLCALALAARTRRELVTVAAAFAATQLPAVWMGGILTGRFTPRFLEAGMALGAAYVAAEVLLLPAASWRWVMAGVLGLFFGVNLRHFVSGSGFHTGYVLIGALAAQVAALALLGLTRVKAGTMRFGGGLIRGAGTLLLAAGLVRFVLGIR